MKLDRHQPLDFNLALVEVAFSLARRVATRPEDAEDIAQEALLKLITYGRAVENPVPWLFVVIRRLQGRRFSTSGLTPNRSTPSSDPWPEAELRIDTERLLRRTSARARASMTLALGGYNQRETAERLGCSLKAAEKSLERARRQMLSLRGVGKKPVSSQLK